MKLAVIFTGGTIASRSDGKYISTSEQQNHELLKALDPDIEVETFSPYFILSEQLDGELLTKLVSCVGDRLSGNFDGIIIAHGTDTLQYSAAALSLAFGETNTPIVLVSSNYVLSDERANGFANFEHAVNFIRRGIGGVYVSYRNKGGEPEIHLGDRLLVHDAYSDSVRGLSSSESKALNLGKTTFSKTSPVLWLRIHPGMRFPNADGAKAVLLESYHSGTLPTNNEDFAVFCKSCRAPIYLVGAPNGARYESTRVFGELGIKILPAIAPIYAYIKLWAEFSQSP